MNVVGPAIFTKNWQIIAVTNPHQQDKRICLAAFSSWCFLHEGQLPVRVLKCNLILSDQTLEEQYLFKVLCSYGSFYLDLF